MNPNESYENTEQRRKIIILDEKEKLPREDIPPNKNKQNICYVYDKRNGILLPSKKI